MSKRRYSDEERASALAALAANAGNIKRTADLLGIPQTTLRHWSDGDRHPESAQMGDQKKGELADKLETVAHKLVDAMPKKIAKAPLNQVAVSMGIAIEKMRLLRNETTSNLGGPANDDETSERIAALLDAARARRDQQAAGNSETPPVDPVPGEATGDGSE